MILLAPGHLGHIRGPTAKLPNPNQRVSEELSRSGVHRSIGAEVPFSDAAAVAGCGAIKKMDSTPPSDLIKR